MMKKESHSWAPNQNWLQMTRDCRNEWSSLTGKQLFGNSLFDSEKTALFLTHSLITVYPLKDSKKPYSNLFE